MNKGYIEGIRCFLKDYPRLFWGTAEGSRQKRKPSHVKKSRFYDAGQAEKKIYINMYMYINKFVYTQR